MWLMCLIPITAGFCFLYLIFTHEKVTCLNYQDVRQFLERHREHVADDARSVLALVEDARDRYLRIDGEESQNAKWCATHVAQLRRRLGMRVSSRRGRIPLHGLKRNFGIP